MMKHIFKTCLCILLCMFGFTEIYAQTKDLDPNSLTLQIKECNDKIISCDERDNDKRKSIKNSISSMQQTEREQKIEELNSLKKYMTEKEYEDSVKEIDGEIRLYIQETESRLNGAAEGELKTIAEEKKKSQERKDELLESLLKSEFSLETQNVMYDSYDAKKAIIYLSVIIPRFDNEVIKVPYELKMNPGETKGDLADRAEIESAKSFVAFVLYKIRLKENENDKYYVQITAVDIYEAGKADNPVKHYPVTKESKSFLAGRL